jgi:hypothetical protein
MARRQWYRSSSAMPDRTAAQCLIALDPVEIVLTNIGAEIAPGPLSAPPVQTEKPLPFGAPIHGAGGSGARALQIPRKGFSSEPS